MEKTAIFSKTAKGLREVEGKTKVLPRNLRSLLKEIDGTTPFGDLVDRLADDWPESDLQRGLSYLVREGFMRELILEAHSIPQPPGRLLLRKPKLQSSAPSQVDDSLEDLDFTSELPATVTKAEEKARREAEEKVRREAEERARREAEERARREAEEKARREAEEKARVEAEERARKEAAERVRREAEERARKEAEEKARREAEEKARREAEEQARREAEEKARIEAEERARKEAEEKARKEAAERARREAEGRARKEAEEKARVEAEERERKEAEEKARREAEECARKEAEEKARREAEERARREVEEKARIEAEERAHKEAEEKARREAEEKARREAEVKARAEAEERARKEAEEKARREAEEKARIEAEERARKEAEEKARKEAAERARREAEERARKEAEEKARVEAEERERKEAEGKARREAEECARKEAEEKARREAEERARREAEEKVRIEEKSRQATAKIHTERREPIKWGRLLALGFVALVAMVIVAVNSISFESRIPDFERAASAWFQQPVKIKSLRVAFLPHAQWQLEGVAIGSQGQILAPRINVPTSYAALFDKSNMTFDSLQVDTPVIGTEGMGWLLFGRSRSPGLPIRHVQATNIKFAVPGMRLPAFDATMEIGADGNWQKIGIVAMEKKVEVQLTAGKGVRLEMKLSQSALPFGALPVLDDLTAGGTLDRRSLLLDEFNASLSGGSLRGRARVVWGSDAILDGDVTARGIDMGQMLAGFMEGGRLEGKANFSLPIFGDGKTAGAASLTGDFAIDRGTLATVDFGRMVKGESGGRTQFKKLTGRVAHRGGETQLRELFVDAGKLTAKGSVDIDARRDIQGQFVVSLNLGAARQRVSIALSGPFKAPYKDLKWE